MLTFESCVPKRYKDYCFNDYKVTDESKKAFDICKRFAESESVKENGSNLVLCGGYGTGKTMLSVCILREFYNREVSIDYTTISELIMKARHSMSYGGSVSGMNSYYTSGCIVVDEIGRQSGSDNELNIIFEILNRRYNNVLPTVLVSNKSSSDIKAFLGDALIDRMKEVNTVFLDMNWKSYRGIK